MEKISILLATSLLGLLLFKILLKPLKWGFRLALNCGAGLLILGLVNSIPSIMIPINSTTILICGTLGLPGVGLLVLLAQYL